MHILGRTTDDGPVATLGTHRAADGSDVAPVGLDLDHPHTALVVGKRGMGKSHTVAVIAEEIAATDGVTGVVLDPMGELTTLATLTGVHVHDPVVRPDALPPRAWCDLLDLDPAGPVGGLVWRVAHDTNSIDEMLAAIADATVDTSTARAAHNHLETARRWSVFNHEGITAPDLLETDLSVIDLGDLPTEPANAVVRTLLDDLYTTLRADQTAPLPWVFLDEAHAFFDGIARRGLRRLLTRGRHPGISTVLATQRPAALPAVAISQADLVLAHRLTADADLDALERIRPTYLTDSLRDRRPDTTGQATVVDDRTEVARAITVRDRQTPDAGASPTATDRTTDDTP